MLTNLNASVDPSTIDLAMPRRLGSRTRDRDRESLASGGPARRNEELPSASTMLDMFGIGPLSHTPSSPLTNFAKPVVHQSHPSQAPLVALIVLGGYDAGASL